MNLSINVLEDTNSLARHTALLSDSEIDRPFPPQFVYTTDRSLVGLKLKRLFVTAHAYG